MLAFQHLTVRSIAEDPTHFSHRAWLFQAWSPRNLYAYWLAFTGLEGAVYMTE